MTKAASPSVPAQGRLRRALAAFGAFLQAMESTSFDYSLDRIERLEREVARLQLEMREGREPGAVEARNTGAGAPGPRP